MPHGQSGHEAHGAAGDARGARMDRRRPCGEVRMRPDGWRLHLWAGGECRRAGHAGERRRLGARHRDEHLRDAGHARREHEAAAAACPVGERERGQQGVYLQTAPGRAFPQRQAVHLGRCARLVRALRPCRHRSLDSCAGRSLRHAGSRHLRHRDEGCAPELRGSDVVDHRADHHHSRRRTRTRRRSSFPRWAPGRGSSISSSPMPT